MSTSKYVTGTVLTVAAALSSIGLTACVTKQSQETVGQYVDGSINSTKIKSSILADETLHNTTISVKTYKNTVQLSGFVHTASQKMRAEAIARNVTGVNNVENSLIIQP